MERVSAYLKEYGAQWGVPFSQEQLDRFDTYGDLLTDWNTRMNLTAILEPQAMAVKHFLDSVLPLQVVEFPQGASLIDVGTGAGFPAVPMKIVRPDLQVTLLDSLNKRVTFLKALCGELGLPCEAIHARAEEGGRQERLRERFDFATARAVAHLRELSEYCLPFVKVGGAFLALKGGDCQQELQEAAYAIRQLGGQVERVEHLELPLDNRRTVVVIRKRSQTPAKYPRPSAKIAKFPLDRPGK